MEETIPNYYKDHNPTDKEFEAVEKQNKDRKISCDKILREHMEKELEKRRNKLLITKTKKK